MKRAPALAGLVGGTLVLLSSAAHSLLGWKQLSAELAKAQAPSDLVRGLALGWHYGGAAMVAFGVIAIVICVAALRGRPLDAFPLAVIGAVYVIFGSVAFAVAGRDPFFLIFIVPGLLLLWPGMARSVR